MCADENKPDQPLGRLPEALLDRIRSEVPAEQIRSTSPYDLDDHGMYVEGHLVLSERKLGCCLHRDGAWQCRWLPLANLDGAEVVEGLGMNLLRLHQGGKTVAEFRFTLRHAREMAKLHRQIERQLDGKEHPPEAEAKGPRGDDKKVRCEKCDRVIPPWSEFCPACMSRRKVLSRLLDFIGAYRWQAGVGFSLAILATLMQLVRPYLTKPMLNDGLGAAKGKTANYQVLLTYIAISVGLMVIGAIFNAIRTRLMALLGARVARDIRNRTYDHLHKLALSFYAKKPTGSLVTRITSDSERIWDFVATTVIEVCLAFLTVIGVGVALLILNWKLALFVLMPVPLMMFFMVLFHQRMHGHFRRLFHRWSQMTAIVADALPGIRVIKAFSQEKREVDRFGSKNEQVYESEMGMITIWTLFGPVLQLCSQIGGILVWVVGGYWAVQGKVDPGTLMAYISYMWMFYGPIHQISHMDRSFNRAATSVARIFEVLDTAPTIYSHGAAERHSAITGRIEMRNVSFSYDGVRKVLKNVDLEIQPGQMIGLAGPSGGGKTTMVNLICRFYDTLEGQILVDGLDVRDYDLEWLRRQIGVVLQEPFLFHGTVAENIAYGNPEARLEEIIAAARAANAHDFIVGFPDGYDTMIGERGQSLSGGERQRISIARAILHNPSILILDEATSSVDTETEKLIQTALDRLVANRTTIAIAHRLSTLRKADHLVILDKGQIVEQGSHEELAAKEGGVYAKLIRMQDELQSVIAIAG